MVGRLKLRARPADDPDLIRVLSAMDDAEWADLADKVRAEGLVPLAHLVIEGLADTIDRLADRLAGQVVLDDIGRRCVPREVARELFADRDRWKAEAEARARAGWAEREAESEQMRARLRAIQQAQEAAGGPGLLRAEQ